MPWNCKGQKASANAIKNANQMEEKLNQLPRRDFIEVQSAFMMLAIYKMDVVVGIQYSGRGILQSREIIILQPRKLTSQLMFGSIYLYSILMVMHNGNLSKSNNHPPEA